MEAWVEALLSAHPVLAPVIFVFLRAVPVVVAVLPGIFLDFISVVVFGWKLGLVLAQLGLLLGAMSAFYIARFFREPVVRRFAGLEKIHEFEGKFSNKQKFWGLVLLRLTTIPFFDIVSYAAGLTKLSPWLFGTTTVLGTFPVLFGIYYFGGFFAEKGPWMIALFGVLVFLILGVTNFLSNRGQVDALFSHFSKNKEEKS